MAKYYKTAKLQNIPIKLIEHKPTSLLKIITEIFNKSVLQNADIPKDWLATGIH